MLKFVACGSFCKIRFRNQSQKGFSSQSSFFVSCVQVITIFSASNYYEEGSNRGAYIKLNPELIPRFVQYQVSKHTRRQRLQER